MGLSLKDLLPKEIMADFQNAGKLMETLAQRILNIEADVKEIKLDVKDIKEYLIEGGTYGRPDTNRPKIRAFTAADGTESKSAGDGEKGGN